MVRLRLLRALRPFDQLSDEILTRAAPLFTYREYPTSDTLVAREGAADAGVHILTQGEVRLSPPSPFTPQLTPRLHPPPTSTHLHPPPPTSTHLHLPPPTSTHLHLPATCPLPA